MATIDPLRVGWVALRFFSGGAWLGTPRRCWQGAWGSVDGSWELVCGKGQRLRAAGGRFAGRAARHNGRHHTPFSGPCGLAWLGLGTRLVLWAAATVAVAAVSDPLAPRDVSTCASYLCSAYSSAAERFIANGCEGSFAEAISLDAEASASRCVPRLSSSCPCWGPLAGVVLVLFALSYLSFLHLSPSCPPLRLATACPLRPQLGPRGPLHGGHAARQRRLRRRGPCCRRRRWLPPGCIG